MAEWFTAKELADRQLDGLPATERAVQLRAKREGWNCRKREGRGGGLEYPLSALPAKAIAAYRLRHEQPAAPALPPAASSAPASVAAWQIACRDARLVLLGEVDTIRVRAGLSARQAILALVDLARKGQLRADLQALIPTANAKCGKAGTRTLALRTVQLWHAAREAEGPDALLPKAPPKSGTPLWAPYLLRAWQVPTNPSLPQVLEDFLPDLLPDGIPMPSYDQARHYMRSLPPQERMRGRMGPRQLKSLKAYNKRDVSQLWPAAVYVADGHTFDAQVAHPISGRPFRPEITTVIDVYTRRIVGWSTGLSENTWGVADAWRRSMMVSVCAIAYVDLGKGFNNQVMDDPLTGLFARLQVTKTNSLPYNSQARGVSERSHAIWTRAAKRLPTYMGKPMDEEAKHRVHKRLQADIRDTGSSPLLMSWEDFVRFCQETVDAYNARPHTGLPRWRAPEGRMRHMSPLEAWETAEAEGWQADPMSAAEADDAFRPYEVRKTRRALVEIFRNEYFHTGLEPYHDQEVAVGYDIHDASHVWVREVERAPEGHRLGRLICVAEWNGHASSYFPVSAVMDAERRRTEGRVRRQERHLEEARREFEPLALDHQPIATPVEITAEEQQLADAMLARLEPVAEAPVARMAGERPIFASDLEWARWVLEHPTAATPQDGDGLRQKLRSRPFRDLLEMEGVDVPALQELTEQLRGVLCA